MNPTELRKQFLLFIVAAAVITALLIILPIIEPFLKRYVAEFFSSTEERMGATASQLFEHFLNILEIILWMALVIISVRFINSLIFGTALRKSGSYELSTLLRNVISIIIYIVAFFVIFNSQYPRVDLAALFTTSTIIGVVIGLALQDTLGNLFAGIALQADQPFQVGDVVVIPNKGTGVVESVTWRGVKIRTFQNKLIIISNAILGKEAIEVAPRDNLNARVLFFNTLYTNAPAKTIQVVRDAVRQVENVSPKMRPNVRIKNLGDNGIDWEIKYWLDDYTKFNDTDALIRQRIWYVFQREKIDFAYPTRTLYIENQPQEDVFVESTDDICERISNVPIFAPLSDKETAKLANASLVRVFAPNEPIVRKGQESGSMFIVHRGSVKVQIVEKGITKTINTLREGDIFGEMGLFTGEPRTANVVAVEETEVLEINHTAIKPLFEDNPNLVIALSKTIAERRAMLAQQNEEVKKTSAEEETAGIFDGIRKFFGLN
jgi:small-conductance mechanosensitive channel